MPFAMCCSPKAAVSKSDDAGCVVENDRRGTRIGRERAGTRLRRADVELVGIMAAVVIVVTVLLEAEVNYYVLRAASHGLT